jgi:hypothetical protein
LRTTPPTFLLTFHEDHFDFACLCTLPYQDHRLPQSQNVRQGFSKGWQALGRNSGQIATLTGAYGLGTSEQERLKHRQKAIDAVVAGFRKFGTAVRKGAQYPRFEEDYDQDEEYESGPEESTEKYSTDLDYEDDFE